MKSLLSLAFLSLGVLSFSQNAQAAEPLSQPAVKRHGTCMPGFHRQCYIVRGGFRECICVRNQPAVNQKGPCAHWDCDESGCRCVS